MPFGDTLACCTLCGTVVVAAGVAHLPADYESLGAGESFHGVHCRACGCREFRLLIGPLRVPRPAGEEVAST